MATKEQCIENCFPWRRKSFTSLIKTHQKKNPQNQKNEKPTGITCIMWSINSMLAYSNCSDTWISVLKWVFLLK